MTKLQDKIAKAFRKNPNASYAQIAREANCNNQYARLVALGICKDKKRRPTTETERQAKIRELYNGGCNDAEIARQIGCNKAVIWQWRMANALPPVEPAPPSREDGSVSSVIAREYARNPNATTQQIAAVANCRPEYVRVWKQRNLVAA